MPFVDEAIPFHHFLIGHIDTMYSNCFKSASSSAFCVVCSLFVNLSLLDSYMVR